MLTEWPKITAACPPLLEWGCMKGKPAVYTLIQFILILAGVAPDLTLRFTAYKKVRVQLREPPWL